jgi:2,3-bisphosphoglycerate-independent phosphoglycerate mutase
VYQRTVATKIISLSFAFRLDVKTIVIIGDGMADEPLEELGGKTPLEYANIPNMDLLANHGANGEFYAIQAGITVDSDAAHLALLGQDVDLSYSNRGAYESLGAGLNLGPGDIGFRVNFATINNDFTLVDGRAGRIKSEAKQLEEAINSKLTLDAAEFEFKQTVGFKGALVLKDKNFTTGVKLPAQYDIGKKIWAQALTNSQGNLSTAETLNEFMKKSHEILRIHPLNLQRVADGKPPANVIMPWALGSIENMKPVMTKFGKCLCIAAVPVIKGVCRYSGMDIVDVPNVTGEWDTDTISKSTVALKHLKEYDLILIHVEGTDEASHDGDVEGKLIIIEKIDDMIGHILDAVNPTQLRFALLSDHGSSSIKHVHMTEAVPIAVCGKGVKPDNVTKYSEKSARAGRLNTVIGKDLMPLLVRPTI